MEVLWIISWNIHTINRKPDKPMKGRNSISRKQGCMIRFGLMASQQISAVFIFKLALTLILLGVVFFYVDVFAVWQRISSINPFWFLAALICLAFGYVLCGLRWAWIAKGLGVNVSRKQKVRLYFLGMFASLFLPSTIGGDVVRGVLMAKGDKRKAYRLHAVASVILDRLNGLYALVLLLTVCMGFFSWPLAWWISWLCIMLAMWGIKLAYPWLHTRLPIFLAKVKQLPLHQREFQRMWWKSLPVSLVFQLLIVQAHWCLGMAVGLDMPWAAYAVMVGLVALVAILPISLNGFGVREAGYVGFAVYFQASVDAATAMAALWVIVLALASLPGAWVLWRMGGMRHLKEEC